MQPFPPNKPCLTTLFFVLIILGSENGAVTLSKCLFQMRAQDHPVPTIPAMSRDTSHWTGLPKALSNLALNTARTGASTASPGNLFHHLHIKDFLVNILSKCPSPFQFVAIAPCPTVHHQTIKLTHKTRIYLPNFIQHGFK